MISASHDSAWLSPYTWVVGRLAALFDGNALTALSVAAVINVALVLVAFRSFVVELTSNRRAPFYALLAALLLWGPRAWRWSGVIHVDSIGYVAPYPSMLALALFLFVLTIASRLARTGVTAADWWRLVVLGVGVALVALCHPPTGVVLAIAGPALVLCRCRPLAWRTLAWLALPVAVGLGVAMLWPFFPLFDLSPSGFYATSDELFYQSVPQRIFPALLGLIVVYRRSRADWRDPIAWLIVSALVLYGIGTWSGIGRSIIFAVLLLQVAVGDGLGRIEAAWAAHRVERWQQGYAVAFGVLALLGLVFLRAGPVRMIPEELRPSGLADDKELAKVSDTYGRLRRLLPRLRPDAVVRHAFDLLPAFTGRFDRELLDVRRQARQLGLLGEPASRRRRRDSTAALPTSSSARRRTTLAGGRS